MIPFRNVMVTRFFLICAIFKSAFRTFMKRTIFQVFCKTGYIHILIISMFIRFLFFSLKGIVLL
jgi:hypothetical protein